jgi:hypothetical protein
MRSLLDYLSALATVVKVAFKFVPIVFHTYSGADRVPGRVL